MAELKSLAPLNPFAVVVLAQLECRATRPNDRRMATKLRLAQSLSKWGYNGEDRRMLFIVLDALLALPEALDDRFIESLEKTEDPAMMQQLNSYERVLLRREKAAGLEEGLQRGRQEGMLEGKLEGVANVFTAILERKFGTLPEWAAAHIAHADASTLERWAINILEADRIEDVFD
jgi:flagellar biosynthesis/type III secretory pathway protein FliH